MALHRVYPRTMRHHLSPRPALGALIAVLACSVAFAEETTNASSSQPPGVVQKAANAVERGAKATANGIERGAKAAARGVERGAKAAANGVERGVKATARVAGKVVNKVTGSSPSDAQK